MASKSSINLLAALALFLCVEFCLAAPVKVVGNNETLNAQCRRWPDSNTAPMPDQYCDPQHYVMCEKIFADTIGDCGTKMRYNHNSTWCEPRENVPLPTGCVEQRKRIPTSCAEEGAEKVAVNGTCKFYKMCASSQEYVMPCPNRSFFIPEESECMSLMEPYVYDMPADRRAECIRMDPYAPPSPRPSG
jgi:hypothetical protein